MCSANLKQSLLELQNISPPEQVELGLERMQQAVVDLKLANWGNTRIITVAGTNGKGSTCAFLEQLLLHHNFSVGMYSSPHLQSYSERFRINNHSVAEEVLLVAIEKIVNYAKKKTNSLTYFELTTLIGFELFQQSTLDFVILEVGLGGRLDATNVAPNQASIITSIGLEHQTFLGDSLHQIASQKAGIIKPQNRVVLGKNLPPICLKTAQHYQSSPILSIDQDIFIQHNHSNWQLNLPKQGRCWNALRLPAMPGYWQLINASMAISLLDSFAIPLTTRTINQALQSTRLLGRLTRFEYGSSDNRGEGWLEVGHNPQAIEQVSAYLATINEEKISVIYSCYQDKHSQQIFKLLDGQVSEWYFIELNSPRAKKIETMRKEWQSFSLNNQSVRQKSALFYALAEFLSPKQALQSALLTITGQSKPSEPTKIIIIGSFELIQWACQLVRLKVV